MPPARERRPWPMKWIVLAIVIVIVPYTFLTLRYRKPGPAFQPYEDMKNRANVSRLLSAGYQRLTLPAQRPSDPVPPASTVNTRPTAGGLPDELTATLVERPRLPEVIVSVSAPDTANTLRAYPIQFTCALADDKQQLGGAEMYAKDAEIVIAPTFERIGGELLSRTRETTVLVTVPAGVLKPGTYDVRIAAERSGRAWTLEVR